LSRSRKSLISCVASHSGRGCHMPFVVLAPSVVARLARRHGFWLIYDDTYAHLVFRPASA